MRKMTFEYTSRDESDKRCHRCQADSRSPARPPKTRLIRTRFVFNGSCHPRTSARTDGRRPVGRMDGRSPRPDGRSGGRTVPSTLHPSAAPRLLPCVPLSPAIWVSWTLFQFDFPNFPSIQKVQYCIILEVSGFETVTGERSVNNGEQSYATSYFLCLTEFRSPVKIGFVWATQCHDCFC